MNLADLKAELGIERIVWVDDVFGRTPDKLAELVERYPTSANDFPEIADAVQRMIDFNQSSTELIERIGVLERSRFLALQDAAYEAERQAENFEVGELRASVVEAACEVLGVTGEDRLTFDAMAKRIGEGLSQGSAVAYILDLNEAGVANDRGLEIIAELAKQNPDAIAFILTHTADINDEWQHEKNWAPELQAKLGGAATGSPPVVTLVSKKRIEGDTEAIEAGFAAGLKRAGLRMVLRDALNAALPHVADAYVDAANTLLSLPPESLKRDVFDRGYIEGISPMHVVERSVSAMVSQRMRRFFANDNVAMAAARRLRAMENIALATGPGAPPAELEDLRLAETWDDEETINRSLSPISSGDVFCEDESEVAKRTDDCRRYVLIGQVCDITIRRNGTRVGTTAWLVPMTAPSTAALAAGENDKSPDLKFALDGRRWRFNIREAAVVDLETLDLASLREDGRVCVDTDQAKPVDLLDGLSAIYDARTQAARELLGAAPAPEGPLDHRFILTSNPSKHFKSVGAGRYKPSNPVDKGRQLPARPARITWQLRRLGRMRQEHAVAVLDALLRQIGRPAYDLDFTKLREP